VIEAVDMEAAISRVRDFMSVQGPGSTEALELHWQAAGVAPEAICRLIDFVMEGQPPEAADAAAQVVSQAAATALIVAEVARERKGA
jgi:hypothetical protein